MNQPLALSMLNYNNWSSHALFCALTGLTCWHGVCLSCIDPWLRSTSGVLDDVWWAWVHVCWAWVFGFANSVMTSCWSQLWQFQNLTSFDTWNDIIGSVFLNVLQTRNDHKSFIQTQLIRFLIPINYQKIIENSTKWIIQKHDKII